MKTGVTTTVKIGHVSLQVDNAATLNEPIKADALSPAQHRLLTAIIQRRGDVTLKDLATVAANLASFGGYNSPEWEFRQELLDAVNKVDRNTVRPHDSQGRKYADGQGRWVSSSLDALTEIGVCLAVTLQGGTGASQAGAAAALDGNALLLASKTKDAAGGGHPYERTMAHLASLQRAIAQAGGAELLEHLQQGSNFRGAVCLTTPSGQSIFVGWGTNDSDPRQTTIATLLKPVQRHDSSAMFEPRFSNPDLSEDDVRAAVQQAVAACLRGEPPKFADAADCLKQ